jgi:Mg2+/citrate symporter
MTNEEMRMLMFNIVYFGVAQASGLLFRASRPKPLAGERWLHYCQ